MPRPAEGTESIDSITARLTRADVACFIYTSGTGGTPKGVMLTHGSILCNCRGAYHLLKELGVGDEVFLCFLPLSHSYEHTVGQLFPMSIGAQIYYAESIEKLLENMAEARPTIMTAVPRLYEAMHQRILRGIAKASPLQRRLFDMAVTLGRQRCRGESLEPRRARPGSAGGGHGAPQGPGALRGPAQGLGLRRRRPQSGDRALLPRAGRAAAPGLWPDRGLPGDQRQSAAADQDRDGGPGAGGGGGQDRRGRRDPGALRGGDEGLLARGGRDRGGRSARAGSIPATSAASTPRAI